MADYLVYWRVFWDEVGSSEAKELRSYLRSFTVHDWYTANKRFYDKLKRGDSLWVVITGGPSYPDEWRLLQRVVMQRKDAKKYNLPFYGPHRVIGDTGQSTLLYPYSQRDFTSVLHSLEFRTGKRIALQGRQIGLALQSGGHRQLSEADATLLLAYMTTLENV